MQPKVERPWGARIRYGVLGLVFLTGIFSALGSYDVFEAGVLTYSSGQVANTPPEKWSDEQIEYAENQITASEDQIELMQKEMAETEHQGARADLMNTMAEEVEKLEFWKNKLDQAQKARDTGSCFPAEMRVLTESGAKPIDEIKVGDKVLSADGQGRRVAAEVLKTYADRNRHYYLINSGIQVTGMHRFFTDKGWKRAKELQEGDRIQTASGAFEEITAIEWVPADNLPVFNLTIAENHNFFISADGKNGFLVHNSGGGGGSK